MALGVQRVLTSGQESTALKGLELKHKLKSQAKNAITILPGGGINLENALQFKEAGFNEIHCSLSKFHQHVIQPKISMKSPVHFNEFGNSVSDYSKIMDKTMNITKYCLIADAGLFLAAIFL